MSRFKRALREIIESFPSLLSTIIAHIIQFSQNFQFQYLRFRCVHWTVAVTNILGTLENTEC